MSTSTPILFGGAAVALALGELTDVQSVGTTSSAQVHGYLASPGLLDVAAAAFVTGSVLIVLAVATAWAQVRGRGGIATRIGLGMIGVGAVWYSATRVGGDITDLHIAHLAIGAQVSVLDTTPGWVSMYDAPATLAWLLGPIVLWIGLRRAGRTSALLLVAYIVAVAVEVAFAFVSLPVEAVTTLLAVGTVAVMTRTRTIEPAPAAARTAGAHA